MGNRQYREWGTGTGNGTGGISFCFWATDLGSEKLSSEKNLSSVTECTVGKLSSVGVHVTSTVLTEPGIHEPTSFYSLFNATHILPYPHWFNPSAKIILMKFKMGV